MAILANKNGTLTAVKVVKELPSSWGVTEHPHKPGGKITRVSKNNPRQRVFDTVDAALGWINQEALETMVAPSPGGFSLTWAEIRMLQSDARALHSLVKMTMDPERCKQIIAEIERLEDE